MIQHGQPSWSPILELTWLIKNAKLLELDQVVLFLYYNDFYPGETVGDVGYSSYTLFDTLGYPSSFDFTLIKGRIVKRNAWTHFNDRLSYFNLYRFLRTTNQKRRLSNEFTPERINQLSMMSADEFSQASQVSHVKPDLLRLKVLGLTALLRDTSLWDQDTKRRVARTERYLGLMHQWLSDHDIELVLTLVPSPWQFEGENMGSKQFYGLEASLFPRGGLENRIRQFCNEKEIPFCSLFPSFEQFKQNNDEPLYFYNDGHWTPKGHELVAKSLKQCINDLNPSAVVHE